MIQAKFEKSHEGFHSFSVSGHAGFADFGEDIVCAGVSSAVQLTVNAITEILQLDVGVEVEENLIRLTLPEPTAKPERWREAQHFIEAFRLQLVLLAEDYPNRIQITDLEV